MLYYRDLHRQWYPQCEAAARTLAAGAWPLWNRWLSFGQPLLALGNANGQIAYPLAWPSLVLPLRFSYTAFALIHLAVAGLGMYALCRRLGLGRAAAMVAGLVFEAGGPLVSLVNLWNHFSGVALLPWVVLAADHALETGALRFVAAWGAAVALTVTTGSPESLMMGTAAALVIGARHLLPAPGRLFRPRRLLVPLAAAAIAVGLSAVQWLPTADVARRSERTAFPAGSRLLWSLHPLALVQTVLPIVSDTLPLAPGVRDVLADGREPLLRSLYLGLPTLALAALALASRRRLAAAAAGLLLLAVFYAFGRHTPAYGLAIAAFPPLRALRFPTKMLGLAGFAWALLAGLGFDAWRRRGAGAPTLALAFLAVGGAVALAACLALGPAAGWSGPLLLDRGTGWARFSDRELLAPLALAAGRAAALAALAFITLRRGPGPAAQRAFAAITALDLVLAAWPVNPTAPATLLTERPPIVGLATPPALQRLYVFDYDHDRSLTYLGRPAAYLMRGIVGAPEWTEAFGMRAALVPATAQGFGLETSLEPDLLGLYPAPLVRLANIARLMDGAPEQLTILRLAGVARVVALHDMSPGGLVPLGATPSLFPEPVRVFAVPGALPRARLVPRVSFADDRMAGVRLVSPEFDPLVEGVVAQGDAPALAGAGLRGPGTGDPSAPVGAAEVSALRPDRTDVTTRAAVPSLLVLADSWDAGWRATVDGAPAPVVRVNLAFQGVPVPAGEHRVVLVYRPRAALVGAAITAATLAGLALAGLGSLTRRRAAC